MRAVGLLEEMRTTECWYGLAWVPAVACPDRVSSRVRVSRDVVGAPLGVRRGPCASDMKPLKWCCAESANDLRCSI